MLRIDTPLGSMQAIASERGVVVCDFSDRANLPTELGAGDDSAAGALHLRQLEDELRAYFAGKLRAFTVAIDPRVSDFQRRAWAYLRAIPFGETRSYAQQAAAIGSVARAVGRANGGNFVAIVIPCHRVIGSTGSLTGYGGGIERKKWLLRHEEVPDDRLFR